MEHDPDPDETNYFRYTGQYFDIESGTYYLRARYYNPALGRFTQQDGWAFGDIGDPLSLNLYVELIRRMANTSLMPVEYNEEHNEDARVYYVFKNKRNRIIYSVVIRAWNDSICVNGVEVQVDNVYYDIILPFLPEEAAKEFE